MASPCEPPALSCLLVQSQYTPLCPMLEDRLCGYVRLWNGQKVKGKPYG